MVGFLGPLIGAAGSLIGGIFGQNKADKARAEDYAFAREQAKANVANQKHFAQHGIRWRVRDAKRAGIHPLYALGAQTHSFAPVTVGSPGYAGSPLAQGLADAGQDIGRAVSAGMTGPQQEARYQRTMSELQLQNMGLQNDLLASQIRKINQAGSPPPLPRERGVMELPSGDIAAPVGAGTAAQDLENEYGEVSDIEGGYRYIRDRTPYFLGLVPKASGGKVPWIDIQTPWGWSFRR